MSILLYTLISVQWKQCTKITFDEFRGNFYLALSTAGVREAPILQLYHPVLKIKNMELRFKRNFSHV